jgi:hypothetical protein
MKKLPLLSALWALCFTAPFLSAQNLLIPLLIDSTHSRYYDSATGEQARLSTRSYNYNPQNLNVSVDGASTWTGTPTTYYLDTTIYDVSNRELVHISYRSTVSSAGPWELWIMDSLDYDAQDRVIRTIGHYGSSNQWIPYYDISYWFDDANHRDSILYLLWNAGAQLWENYDRESTYRTADGRILEYHHDMWDENPGSWKSDRNEYYSYLPDGRVSVVRSNDISSNDVETIKTDSSVYTSEGLLDSSFVFSAIPDFNINNLFITDYNYNASDQLISSTTIISSNAGLTFMPNSRQFFEPGDGYYSNDYSFESTEVAVDSDTYVPNSEQTYTFIPLSSGRVLLINSFRFTTPNGSPLKQNTLDSIWYHEPGALGAPLGTAPAPIELRFANPFHPGSSIVCETPATPDALLSYRLCDLSGRLVGGGQAMPGKAWRPFFRLEDGVYWLGVWQNGTYLGGRKLMWVN